MIKPMKAWSTAGVNKKERWWEKKNKQEEETHGFAVIGVVMQKGKLSNGDITHKEYLNASSERNLFSTIQNQGSEDHRHFFFLHQELP